MCWAGSFVDRARSDHASLVEFVAWLFGEASRDEAAYRAEVQRLFALLAPAVDARRSAASWLARRIALSSVGETMARFAAPAFGAPLTTADGALDLDATLAQHAQLCKALDSAHFFVRRRLLVASQLLFAVDTGGSTLAAVAVDSDATQAADDARGSIGGGDDADALAASSLLSEAARFVASIGAVRSALARSMPTPGERERFDASAAATFGVLVGPATRVGRGRERD